ncbi:MAG: hypothetical protein EZS28_026781 [Streblomastix strix]|uniref:Uncharacterized protein n=1 Tax=Streblomastix strix TaxID=222440 RepID=A0A5J4V5P9_9EUKA|nr:MAG: hypothetical protein EZS28_026781 [Streblomastix strix]
MSSDESKSVSSRSSGSGLGERDVGDNIPKYLNIFFSLMFPLYPQKKKSNVAFQIILWALFCIILFTLGLFRIDLGTETQTALSKAINYVDLTSLGLSLGKNSMYVLIVVFVIVFGAFTLQVLSAVFYKELIASQPVVIKITRGLVSILLRVLFIPFVSTAITSFDCYSETTLNESGEGISQSFWRADNSLGCFKSVFQIVSFVIALILLLFLFIYSAVVNLLIYTHNPKNGGFFSCPNGVFNLLQGIFVFGIVFSQRLLYGWQFWRGVVGVLVPGVLILMLIIQNPYYSFWSNYLATIPWTIFASMRLFLEIGYAIEESSHVSSPQIIFLIFGVISSVIFIIVIYYIMRILEGRNWLLTSQGLPLVDISEIEQLNQQQSYNYGSSTEQNEAKPSFLNKSPKSQLPGLPKLKDATDIEPRLRFLQDKDIRNNEYIKYADYVYTHAFQRHKKNALLQFQYGIFLQYYRKNWVKAQSVFKLSRSSNPSIPLRFVLYCKTKEGGGAQDAVITELQGGGGGTGDDNTLMKRMIIILILLSHFLAIASAIIGTVANNFSQQIQNLLQVCELAGYISRLPTFAIQTLYLDISYGFKYAGINDGSAETIPTWESLKTSFSTYGQYITDVITIIYDVTSNTQPWEVMDINTYIFDIAHVGTQQTKVEPVMYSQEKQVSSLIRSMTNLAQASQQLGRLNSSLPNVELKTFYSDLQYIIFNALMPILASLKRAMISYYDETNGLITEIILLQVLLVVILLVAIQALMIIMFVFFTIKVHKERKSAL